VQGIFQRKTTRPFVIARFVQRKFPDWLSARRFSAPSPKKLVESRAPLAVLPFENLSGDPEQEYFSDGLTEETIMRFGKMSPHDMGVIARTSSMTYKHSDKSVLQIGRKLGVDYVLEGSVRRAGPSSGHGAIGPSV
jgi:adenylate cyclase